jgi:hypothetical protein
MIIRSRTMVEGVDPAMRVQRPIHLEGFWPIRRPGIQNQMARGASTQTTHRRAMDLMMCTSHAPLVSQTNSMGADRTSLYRHRSPRSNLSSTAVTPNRQHLWEVS